MRWIKRSEVERQRKHQTTKVPVFTLATGSKFLFITAATSSAALKDYFLPSGPAATFPSSPPCPISSQTRRRSPVIHPD